MSNFIIFEPLIHHMNKMKNIKRFGTWRLIALMVLLLIGLVVDLKAQETVVFDEIIDWHWELVRWSKQA